MQRTLPSITRFVSDPRKSACLVFAACLALTSANAADLPSQTSALENNKAGWKDILPGTDLGGWNRVSVPPGGKLGRDQWHVDANKKTLICDGDGGHDMLLYGTEFTNCIFHLEFRYEKIDGKTGYNSGAYVRNSKDGSIWHQAQFGDAKDGFLFGETSTTNGGKTFFSTQQDVKENRVKPAGEWNTLEIVAQGKTLILWVNGAVTSRYENCGTPHGFVGLEGEGYKIEFRNLKVKSLDSIRAHYDAPMSHDSKK